MAILDMEKSLNKFKTIHGPMTAWKYFRWAMVADPQTNIPRFVVRQAYMERKWRIFAFALIVRFGQLIRYWLDKSLPLWLRKKLRDRYYPLEKNPFFGINLQSQELHGQVSSHKLRIND